MNISATAFKGRLAFRRRIKRTTTALASASRLRPGYGATPALGADSAPHHVGEGHYLHRPLSAQTPDMEPERRC